MSNCPLDTGQQDLKTNDRERFPLTMEERKKEGVKVEREREARLVSWTGGWVKQLSCTHLCISACFVCCRGGGEGSSNQLT